MSEHETEDKVNEVLRCFVNAEITKDHCKRIQALYDDGGQGHAWDIIANLADRDKLHLLRRCFEALDDLNEEEVKACARWLGEFGTERKTLIPFTTGSYADIRNQKVQNWRQVSVSLTELWVKETDPPTTAVLRKHKHNIVMAIDEIAALQTHDEWNPAKYPPPIICIEHEVIEERQGKLWLLDGCDRAIGKAMQEPDSDIDAWVGDWVGSVVELGY